jgi:hypothetical protein
LTDGGPGPRAASGQLLLADISGYTSFLRQVAVAHANDSFAGGAIPPAYAAISGLLDGIVERLVPPFTLSKLEGDAVFVFSVDSPLTLRGGELVRCLTDCYAGFRAMLAEAERIWPCSCEACSGIESLDLKFVVHAGHFVVQSIAGGQELVGPEVVLVHRLLKTSAGELVGHGAHALITDTVVTGYDVPTADALPLVEHYEHYAPVDAHVLSLRA